LFLYFDFLPFSKKATQKEQEGTTTIYIILANIDVENGMKSFKGFI